MQTLETLAQNLERYLMPFFVSTKTTPVYIGARVYASGVQTVGSGAFTALSFTNARWDTDGLWSAGVATRLTCTRAGVYAMSGHVRWVANASGERGLQLRVGGATSVASVVVPAAGNGNVTDLSISTIYQLAVGDYLELTAYQSSGGFLNVSAAGAFSPELAMHRLA